MAQYGDNFDVVIIGAGAGGVAAGKRLQSSKLRFLVIEARSRLGGRAWTVPTRLGKPIDLGCEWLHSADINSWSNIAVEEGFTLDKTPPDWASRVAIHRGEAANADWLAARDAFEEAYDRAALESEDRPASSLLPQGGPWNALLGAISTWANGAELELVSVKDHARYANTQVNWRVLEGYGTLIASRGADLPVVFNTAAREIDRRGAALRIATPRGTITTKTAIVTVPTNIIAEEGLRFTPALPEKLAAAAGLPLGIANKLFLALDGAEPAAAYRHFVGSLDRVATGNYQIRPHGWPMISCYFGGRLATELERAGMAAMAGFAIDELAGLYGGDIRRRLRPLASSAWVGDPFARGSYSSALPGHADDRAMFARPVEERIFFAGEACSRDQFGTAHAAFTSGVAAAEQAISALARSKAEA
ncbi:MAG TPA: NAD(P)/FAD-dependent oxidoreductase [Stellaceae bacterium]|nr:NAD(P)/FAD-dependent oxidoreductase [Stellaceae bacterium]